MKWNGSSSISAIIWVLLVLVLEMCSSATIRSCKDLLTIIDDSSLSNFPVFFFDDHPKVTRAIEICRVLRGDTAKEKEISVEEDSLIEAMKRFENEGSAEPCMLIAYGGQNMRKEILKIGKSRRGAKRLRSARSLKAIGPCSWILYTRRNYKGDSVTLSGDKEYNKPSDWGWIPGQIRSIKLNASP